MKTERNLTPMRETFATGLAAGLSQAAAFRQAFPHSAKWSERAVWTEASKLASRPEVRQRVEILGAKAAAANEVTVERVVRELARVAFGDRRKLMSWGARGLRLVESTELDEADAAAVAEVSETVGVNGGSLKLKTHDKVRALELLGRHVGMFEKDNAQKTDPLSALLGRLSGDVFEPMASAGLPDAEVGGDDTDDLEADGED